MGDGKAAAAAVTGGAELGKMITGQQNKRSQENANRATHEEQEDTANRKESTYRYYQQMMMGALSDYYQKQGWKMPATSTELPGFGTTKQLPFEPRLYGGNPDQVPTTNPVPANNQPSKPTFVDPQAQNPQTAPTDGTDGTQSSGSPEATNPAQRTSGKPQNDLPAQNDQQKISQSIQALLGQSPDDALQALKLRGANGYV